MAPINPWLRQELHQRITGQPSWLDTIWQPNQLPANVHPMVTAFINGVYPFQPVPGPGQPIQQGPDIAQELTLMLMELVVVLGHCIPGGMQQHPQIRQYVKLALGLKVCCHTLARSSNERSPL